MGFGYPTVVTAMCEAPTALHWNAVRLEIKLISKQEEGSEIYKFSL